MSQSSPEGITLSKGSTLVSAELSINEEKVLSVKQKLAQRQVYLNQHIINVGLTGNVGYISIEDNGLYPDEDSRTHRRDLGFNSIMIPQMTRQQLKDLRKSIKEVLKNSK